jgi:hypothetical protein
MAVKWGQLCKKVIKLTKNGSMGKSRELMKLIDIIDYFGK